jgi:signal transduction histidine kinase
LVLVLTPAGRDGLITRELLQRDGHTARLCADVDELCAAIAAGAGVALIAEEVLSRPAVVRLGALLADQGAWSDFPILVFSGRGDGVHRPLSDALMSLGNVSFLDRPVHVRTMLAAVHAALRGRRRQYAARRAIASRDQFLAMLGHELRNPLGAIQLAGDLLGQERKPSDHERHRKVIARQTRHLARLVDDLLDVARVTYGKVTLHNDAVDLGEVVQTCFQSLMQTAARQGLEYVMQPASEPHIVWGDRVRLEQVFSNLLTNAIKYTPRGGTVRVAMERDATAAHVLVADTGIGIAEDMQEAVFELFAQADRSLERAKGGIGLGLTLVRSLVHLHGGIVAVQSSGLGRGSDFRVSLPLFSAARAAAEESPCEEAVSRGGVRVVVVEDNEDIRELQEELLRLEGHEVLQASDGPSGVALILSTDPDVALVDIGLPGFDGFEVARRVRAQSKKPVRLIAVSGYGQAEDRERALRAGFDEHLTKPVGCEELFESVHG